MDHVKPHHLPAPRVSSFPRSMPSMSGQIVHISQWPNPDMSINHPPPRSSHFTKLTSENRFRFSIPGLSLSTNLINRPFFNFVILNCTDSSSSISPTQVPSSRSFRSASPSVPGLPWDGRLEMSFEAAVSMMSFGSTSFAELLPWWPALLILHGWLSRRDEAMERC